MKSESQSYQEEFVRRLIARRPQDRERLQSILPPPQGSESSLESPGRAAPPREMLGESLENYQALMKGRPVREGMVEESTAAPEPFVLPELALETIVLAERPVFFVKDGKVDTGEAAILGPDAEDLAEKMKAAAPSLEPMLPLIGRIDVVNFPNNMPFVGTGWFVDSDIVVTNRHVASLIARRDGLKYVFSLGMGGEAISSSFCNGHEYDDTEPAADRVFEVKEVLFIEKDSSRNDIAFLRVKGRPNGNAPVRIEVAESDVAADELVCVVGYPARAPISVIPDQNLMRKLYMGRYDIKRAAPGYSMPSQGGLGRHDCTTLGGNSGSVLLNLQTGKAVGLHFSGRYMEANFTVGAATLSDYVKRKRWNLPLEITEGPRGPSPTPTPAPKPPVEGGNAAVAANGSVTIPLNIPLTLTVSLGLGGAVSSAAQLTIGAGDAGGTSRPSLVEKAKAVEDAVAGYWQTRPEGVLAARVGFLDQDDAIGDEPCIAVSVMPALLAGFEANGIQAFQGIPVRYFPAEPGEQIEAMPEAEAAGSISYDDSARTGAKFSFEAVQEEMEVLLHVGPEYSWSTLKTFLEGSRKRLVSAIYEFHAKSVKDTLEERIKSGVDLKLVMDNATLSSKKDTAEEFNTSAVFKRWASDDSINFQHIVVPEGVNGLIANAYHIKVTVRDDDSFWLSSGNWKMSSSQPEISDEELQAAAAGEADLPGNREWHVVIKNETLASRFRNHILQDFKRSEELGAQESPVPGIMDEIFVDVPIEEASMIEERRAPSGVLKPLKIKGSIKVRPLLTPDREGAVYSEAVLQLIRNAKRSLLFQIPYIGMRPNPRVRRGYIDDLIDALTDKLTSLDDARVILRSGGTKFSSPTHAAWYFKSKGVDIDERLRLIENHHTKGMMVDGKRVLIGSHNWSQPGVTLNRDASLIFDDERAAGYYAQAFEIDWARSNKIRPKRFVKQTEAPVLEAAGDAPPPGYQRIPLSQWLKDE